MLRSVATIRQLGTVFGVLLLAACSGGAFSGQSKDRTDGDEDEDTKGDEPSEVSGAFLTCTYLSEADDTGASMVGCGVYEGTKKMSGTGRSFALALFDDSDDEQDMETTSAVDASPWHVLGKLPASAKLGGYLLMTVKEGSKSRGYRLKTQDIQPIGSMLGTSAGNEFEDASGEDLDESAKISSFKFHAVWNGGGVGLIAEGIMASDFCDTNGQIRPSLQSLSQAMISFFGGGVKTEIERKEGKVTLNDSVCLEDFTLLGVSSKKQYAQAGSNGKCLFARTGANELLIISMPKTTDDNLSLASLREFGKRKSCP